MVGIEPEEKIPIALRQISNFLWCHRRHLKSSMVPPAPIFYGATGAKKKTKELRAKEKENKKAKNYKQEFKKLKG